LEIRAVNNDPEKTVLLFNPDEEDIDQLNFSKPLSNGTHAAKFNCSNHLALTALGYSPPSLMSGYHWPGKFKPFENQKITAEFMLSNYRCWVLNEMRSGKTSSTGWALHRGMQLGDIRKVIILAPLSILQTAWYREMFWIHAGKCPILLGDRSVKELKSTITEAQRFKRSILIINHDKVKFAREALEEYAADTIVVDEASAFRNADTDKFQALRKLVSPGTRFWALTAGPCPNAPTDVWGLSTIINPSKTPKFYGRWRDMTMDGYRIGTIVKYRPKKDAEQKVAKLLHPSIKFATADCIDLPPQVYITRKVENSAEQKRLLKEIKAKHVSNTETGEQISAANAAVALSKYLQISCGAVYDSTGESVAIKGAVSRQKEIVDIYHESGNKKMIVFASFKVLQHNVRDYLIKKGISAEIMNGDTPANKRVGLVDKFQTKEDLRVLILHPKVGKFGLTLSAANTTVWLGPTYSAEDFIQSNARAQGARTQHKQKTSIIMLEGSDVEERIYARLRDMEARQNSITDIYRYVFG